MLNHPRTGLTGLSLLNATNFLETGNNSQYMKKWSRHRTTPWTYGSSNYDGDIFLCALNKTTRAKLIAEG
jgi:hypothetical protein